MIVLLCDVLGMSSQDLKEILAFLIALMFFITQYMQARASSQRAKRLEDKVEQKTADISKKVEEKSEEVKTTAAAAATTASAAKDQIENVAGAVKTVEAKVDGRLTELLAINRLVAEQKGVEIGKVAAQVEADKLRHAAKDAVKEVISEINHIQPEQSPPAPEEPKGETP